MMQPEAPPEVLRAAAHCAIGSISGSISWSMGTPFPDNWIYVHSPEVAVARIANYRNFSPDMAALPT